MKLPSKQDRTPFQPYRTKLLVRWDSFPYNIVAQIRIFDLVRENVQNGTNWGGVGYTKNSLKTDRKMTDILMDAGPVELCR